MENTTAKTAESCSNPEIMKMHQRVVKIRANEEVNIKYMRDWEEREEEKKEAREEGREEISSEIVLNMHKQNCPPEQISMFTGINLDTVQEIIRGVAPTT